MFEILNLAVPFFGLILLGVAAARIWRRGEEGLAWINIFLVWFALPALIFKVVAEAPFEKLTSWPFISATAGVTAAAFLLTMAIARLVLGAEARKAALIATAASYGNVGYMGLPLAVAFFGAAAAVPAALVFCFDCTVEFVLTAFFATLAHRENEDAHWGEVALRIVKQVAGHPFIVATVLGAAASAARFQPPAAIATMLDMLMRAAGPCALFALGVTVGQRRMSQAGGELALMSVMKTVLQPAAAALVLSLVPGLDPLWRHVGVMMAALPTASNAFILASQYGTNADGASAAVIVTTAISAVTVPLIVYGMTAGVF